MLCLLPVAHLPKEIKTPGPNHGNSHPQHDSIGEKTGYIHGKKIKAAYIALRVGMSWVPKTLDNPIITHSPFPTSSPFFHLPHPHQQPQHDSIGKKNRLHTWEEDENSIHSLEGWSPKTLVDLDNPILLFILPPPQNPPNSKLKTYPLFWTNTEEES